MNSEEWSCHLCLECGCTPFLNLLYLLDMEGFLRRSISIKCQAAQRCRILKRAACCAFLVTLTSDWIAVVPQWNTDIFTGYLAIVLIWENDQSLMVWHLDVCLNFFFSAIPLHLLVLHGIEIPLHLPAIHVGNSARRGSQPSRANISTWVCLSGECKQNRPVTF